MEPRFRPLTLPRGTYEQTPRYLKKRLALHIGTQQFPYFACVFVILIVAASSARRGKTAVGTATTPAFTAIATAAAAAAEGVAAAAKGDVAGEAPSMAGAGGTSALWVADRVVTEYEKLLEAIPTMAQHMWRLQGDTETMAEGKGRASLYCAPSPHFLSKVVSFPPVSPHS